MAPIRLVVLMSRLVNQYASNSLASRPVTIMPLWNGQWNKCAVRESTN
ncbi:hypothetical protein [Spirosoma telluris]